MAGAIGLVKKNKLNWRDAKSRFVDSGVGVDWAKNAGQLQSGSVTFVSFIVDHLQWQMLTEPASCYPVPLVLSCDVEAPLQQRHDVTLKPQCVIFSSVFLKCILFIPKYDLFHEQ